MPSKGIKPPKVSPPHSDFVEAPQHQPTHDFTLQAIMELQKSIGENSADIRTIKESFNRLDKGLDKIDGRFGSIDTKISSLEKNIYIATGVIVTVTAIAALLNAQWFRDIFLKALST